MSDLSLGRLGAPAISPTLLAAQERLYELRRQHQANCLVSCDSPTARFLPPAKTDLNLEDILQNLPSHLGWGSHSLTSVWRSHYQPSSPEPLSEVIVPPVAVGNVSVQEEKRTGYIKLQPDLALAFLRYKQSGPGRLWLLMRYFDSEGCGWVEEQTAKSMFTEKESWWRLCGWRQLRNLLNQGEDIFWQRRNGRIWLCSMTKVATALGLPRLGGYPVALPVDVLVQKISKVRAHFYASFHSGRDGMPISRETLTTLTAMHERTQRRYEKVSGVRIQTNITLGDVVSKEGIEAANWEHGRAFFVFTDHRGKHGPRDQRYLAWQLPNSYIGPHKQLSRGSQKQINRRLADLSTKGMMGNGYMRHSKCFFHNALTALKASRRQDQRYHYWQPAQSKGKKYRLWYHLPHS